MADVTVIVTMFGRSGNWPEIHAGVRKQRVACELWVWDNRGGPALRGADAQFKSPRNLICWPRWFIAAHAPTDLVVVVDDDLVFGDRDVVGDLCCALRRERPGTLVGAEGVSLRRGASYWPRDRRLMECRADVPGGDSSVHVRNVVEDVRVDIVKGRCIAARRSDLADLPMAAPHAANGDDIVVSALIGKKRAKAHLVTASVTGRLKDCADAHGPMSLSSRIGWRDHRDDVRRHYFK
jgi:hypothetical protein